MSPHIIPIPSQPLSALSPLMLCLAEKQQIPILESLVGPDRGLKPTIYYTRGEHTNHYTTDAVEVN
jgi:hypothetical protein